MEKEYDKQTFKLKKNPRKRNKDKESNSSRDSLELTIQSYKDSNQISQKVTEKVKKLNFFLMIFQQQKTVDSQQHQIENLQK